MKRLWTILIIAVVVTAAIPLLGTEDRARNERRQPNHSPQDRAQSPDCDRAPRTCHSSRDRAVNPSKSSGGKTKCLCSQPRPMPLRIYSSGRHPNG